jgi:Ca2+/Na+ antiporter
MRGEVRMILFSLFSILLLIGLLIQYRALHRLAFRRGLFIQIAMFFFVGVVYLAPDAPRWLVWILLVLCYGFTAVMTLYSINRGRKK